MPIDSVAPLLASIQKSLEAAALAEAVTASRKFVPTAVRVYGVRLPVINALARQHKAGGFVLVQALWRAGAFEERLLAAKLLGSVARKDPERTLALVEEFSSEIQDWAVCDTVGMQSVKAIAAKCDERVLATAEGLLKSAGMWQRRLGIVLLTHYAKQPTRKALIRALTLPLRAEKEPYIKKAIAWLDRDLSRSS